MRRGELLALRWADVDLDGGMIRVERSVEQTKAGLRFKSPKTKNGDHPARLRCFRASGALEGAAGDQARPWTWQGASRKPRVRPLRRRGAEPESILARMGGVCQRARAGHHLPRAAAYARQPADRRR